MAYTDAELRTLIAGGETATVEFKERLRDPELLARLISAFANAEGGVVLVGVGDRGSIIGCDTGEVSRAFHGALARIINPPKVDLEATEVDGKRVATITIGRSASVTVAKSGAFRRDADKVVPLGTQQILQSLQQTGPTSENAAGIAEALHGLTEQVAQLQKQIEDANTIRGQMPNYIIGGIIGAILGALLSALLT